jgi:uncharacterized protein YggE
VLPVTVVVALADASYRLSPQYDRANGSWTVVGDEVVQSFRVETTAVGSAGALVDAAVRGGASAANVVVTPYRSNDLDDGTVERAGTAFEPGDVTVTVAYTYE